MTREPTEEELDYLYSRLEWRVGTGWERCEMPDGGPGLEYTDREERHYQAAPVIMDGEVIGYHVVLWYTDSPRKRWGPSTWGSGKTPAEAIRDGRRRLEGRLEDYAERTDREIPGPLGRRSSGGAGASARESEEPKAEQEALL